MPATAFTAYAAPAELRPNIVFILADDLGYGSLGAYGANPDLVSTPNCDRLALEGLRFVNGYAPCSVCTPSRYAALTGRYCWRTSLNTGVLNTTGSLLIETNRPTIASLLKKEGYQTAAVGKWHLGFGTTDPVDFTKELNPGPLELGFDTFFDLPANHGDRTGAYVQDHWIFGLNRSSPTEPSLPYTPIQGQTAMPLNAPRRIDENVMERLTGEAVTWINARDRNHPFFLYFAPVAVHGPVTPSSATKGSSKAGIYGDWIREFDISVGEILNALEKQGLSDNTLIILSSDNGGVVRPDMVGTPEAIALKAGLKISGPFRGGKHNIWQGGLLVPFIVKWPGVVNPGAQSDALISLVDIYATLAELLKVPLSTGDWEAPDSISFAYALYGQSDVRSRRSLLVTCAYGNSGIISEGWKFIEGTHKPDMKPAALKLFGDQYKPQLYYIRQDITESNDLYQSNPEKAAFLRSELLRLRTQSATRLLQ